MTEKIIQEVGRIDSKDDYGFEGTTVVMEIIETEHKGEATGREWSWFHGACYVEQDPEWWDTTDLFDSWDDAKKQLEEVAKDLYNEYERVTYDR